MFLRIDNMFNKNILCVIPARGGSKGIKLKNIYRVNGKPLIFYTLNFVKNISFFNEIVISTNQKKIKKVCEENGFKIPFMRPKALAGDRISDIQVLRHSLLSAEEYNKTKYDLIIMLQPTSPLRSKKDLKDGINQFLKNQNDSLWSVSKIDTKYHPLKQLLITKDKLSYFSKKGKEIIARQELGETFIRNGVFYIFNRNCIVQNKQLLGKNPGFFEINKKHFNIDKISELKSFELFLNRKIKP